MEPDFAREHVPAEGAAAPERAVEIDVDDVQPVLVGDLLGRRFAPRDAGIVDEDVDPCRARRELDRRPRRRAPESVTSMIDDLGVVALRLHLGAAGLGHLGIAIGDDDPRARLRQRLDAGKPDALPAAGDEGGPAVQPNFSRYIFVLPVLTGVLRDRSRPDGPAVLVEAVQAGRIRRQPRRVARLQIEFADAARREHSELRRHRHRGRCRCRDARRPIRCPASPRPPGRSAGARAGRRWWRHRAGRPASPETKFIFGEPMKPATNRLAGRS